MRLFLLYGSQRHVLRNVGRSRRTLVLLVLQRAFKM